MRSLFVISLIIVSGILHLSAQTKEFNIVPQPKSLKILKGEFKLNYKTKIAATDQWGVKSAGILNDLLMKNFGFKLEFTKKPQKENVIFFVSKDFSKEGYSLSITPKQIEITGSETGNFYALQTLMQMLPVDFKGETKLPAVFISDEPRFQYRGMHLDVSRHFMPVEFVKKFIDLMSQYKFNKFHWHLTDDQGWRIEIKKYPRLTEIGSKRKESQEGRYTTFFKGDGIQVEGFYTQEQIKDVVAYAQARHITVIPEIEMPGHASAALAAYPQFGCKSDYNYEVKKTWGIFKEVFCPTDETFKFLEDVLAETIALFPDSPYIHIGGDEVLKDHWKESAFVQDLMKRENLKDEHEVQSYFIRRIEKFINSKGKSIIGWDEILEGGLAPNATVMSWRGEKGGIEAAKAKHDVIMTPANFLYFDYGQGDPKYEPLNIGNHLSLETVYNYNPVPKELSQEESKFILGAQANVWTEYMKTPEKVEYMVFPRILALSEVNWSLPEGKNYQDFLQRLPNQLARLEAQKVNYRIPEPFGLQNILVNDSGNAKIALTSPIPTARIFYTLDGSEPTEKSAEYKKLIETSLSPNERKDLKIIVVTKNGKKSLIYSGVLLRRAYLEPTELTDKIKGVVFKYYRNTFNFVDEMNAATPTEQGNSESIQLPQFAKRQDLKEPFGVTFEGYINVPNDGIYDFELESDDGSVLMIDEETIVNIDGVHNLRSMSGIAPLKKGFHRLRLKYFQNGNESTLNLRWGIKGTGLRRIYGNELVRKKDVAQK